MNRRHPTLDERWAIRDLVNAVGAVEVLRVLAQIVANDHPGIQAGMDYRSRIMKVAKDIDQDDGTERVNAR